MARVLILTCPGDGHAEHVTAKLAGRGAEVLVVDPADFPATLRLTLAYDPSGGTRRLLHSAGGTVELDSVTALWFRRPGRPTAAPEITAADVREDVESASRALSEDLWDGMECRKVPGTRAAVLHAQRKPSGLALAARLGWELPPTLMTTDADELIDFYNRCDGNVITKPIDLPWPSAQDFSVGRMCELLAPRDMVHAEAITAAPVIVQAYVPKRVELRVTVVGERVFAAEIHSQASNHTRYDWRRYDLAVTPHLPHALPPEVEERCRAVVRAADLCYGAIDLVLTPDGRYVFLELNPSGQYLWIEQLTGMDISGALCDLLLAEK